MTSFVISLSTSVPPKSLQWQQQTVYVHSLRWDIYYNYNYTCNIVEFCGIRMSIWCCEWDTAKLFSLPPFPTTCCKLISSLFSMYCFDLVFKLLFISCEIKLIVVGIYVIVMSQFGLFEYIKMLRWICYCFHIKDDTCRLYCSAVREIEVVKLLNALKAYVGPIRTYEIASETRIKMYTVSYKTSKCVMSIYIFQCLNDEWRISCTRVLKICKMNFKKYFKKLTKLLTSKALQHSEIRRNSR